MAHGKDSPKPRDEVLHPHAVKDNLLTTLRWPIHSQPLGPLRAVPYVPWPDYIKEPGPNMRTCSLPTWAQCLDTWDVDSSVSSGRISGSSGGHESCALSHGPWKERPPLVLAPQHQPRKSNPRLEQLRDKIRAQARWQASCASLGTSVPPSASCFFKTSTVRRKTPKVANALPVPNCRDILRATEYRDKDRTPLSLGRERSRGHHTSVPRTNIKRIKSAACRREIPKSSVPCRTPKGRDSELAGVYAWRKGQALVKQLLGPTPALSRPQSKAPAMELGSQKKAAAVEDPAPHTCLSKPTCAHSDLQGSEHTPSLAFHEQSATIQGAMDILQDLRQQIQAGLELARSSPRLPRKLSPSKPKPQNLPGKRQRGPQSTRDLQGFSESTWTVPEGKRSSLDRTVNLHSQQHWKEALPEQESCPQRAWTAQGQDTSFQRSGNTPEKQNPFSQRPWSALAGQACSQRTFTAYKDWEVSEPSPPSSLARPHPALRQPWSSSFVQRSRPYSKGKSAVPPSSKVKLAWPEPAQGIPQSKPGKEQDTQEAPPCPGIRGSLGQTHSSESLHAFMRQKAQARRQHAMEQKALAAHTLELRNQRLQEVYRKQREAVLGKAIHVVSQRRPGIVTFVPSAIQAGGLEAPGSLETPLQKWSKVTSGMVLGDQEAPDSFCLCLNKPWTRSETQDARHPREGVSGAPLIPSTTSSPDPMKLQAMPWGLSIYLGPQDAEHLGPSGLLHFQYKQARLQALETMADALKQRIDILTTKLHKPTSPDTAGDPASDTLGPSKTPATPTLISPSHLRTLMPQGGRGTPQDWVDGQAKLLLPSTYFQDGPASSPPASVAQVVPHTQPYPAGSSHRASSKDAIEERHRELEKKLQRKMATLQALGACMRSSLGVPAAPDPTCGSFWQEEMPEAKKTDLVTPWTTQSCGRKEPEGPHSGSLQGGHLTNFQMKSLSFLESLKLDQQKQEQALALLRQRVEREVWEAQMALDELVYKHQLKQRVEKPSAQQRPEKTSKREQQHMSGGLEPRTFFVNTVMTRSKSPPSPRRESLKHPEELKAVSAGPSQGLCSLSEPVQQDPASSQRALDKFHFSDRSTSQWSIASPEAGTESSLAFHRFTVAMLEQSLRDEELRARHQAAMLRLRELALEEKARAELTCLEHQIRCLSNVGQEVARAHLWEKQQQAFSRLEKEWKDIQYMKKVCLSLHRDRKQLLQHQQSILSVQRSVADLREELQARARLLQSCSPRVKAAWEEVSEASQRMEGHRPGSPQSHHPQEISESSDVTGLSPAQKEATPPQTTSAADEHLQPPRLEWADVTPGTADPPAESEHDSQGPGKQPCVPLPGLLHLSSLDPGYQKRPAFPAVKNDGGSASQLKPQETKEPAAPGDLQTKASAAWAVERPLATTDSYAWSLHGQCGQSLNGDGPCPKEARVPENRTNQGLDVSRSSEGEPQEEAHGQSEQPRSEACHQESPDIPLAQMEAEQEAVSPAPAACEEEAQPDWHLAGPPSQPAAILDLCSKSVSSNGSGSSGAPALSLTPSVGSASSLSCSSLQEFQKATATLVQLSDSCASLSDLDAEDTLRVDPRWSRELSAHDSWEAPDLPSSFWGLHQGLPQLEGVPGEMGHVTLPGLEGSGARLLSGFSEEEAVAEGSEPGDSLLRTGWPVSLPQAPPPRSGSELSESSSQIWGEEPEENLVDPSPCVEPAPGSSLSKSGLLGLDGSGGPRTNHTSPDPGGEQECSRTGRNLTDILDTGKTRQVSPVATFIVSQPQSPSANDSTLSLSFPSDGSLCKGAGLSKGNMPPEASAGCQEEPQDADTSPSMQKDPLQASPDPKATMTPQASSEDGAPLVTEVASPSCVGGFLPEILSPVDEELSYGSGDLPSSIHRDTHLPPPPPTPQAKSDTQEPNLSSEDFPSPPEEAMFPGDSLDTLGDHMSITAEDLSSLSEALEEALSLGPREPEHCLRTPGQSGNLDDSSSTSSLRNWVVSAPEGSPRLSTRSPSPSPVACVAREVSDSQGGPWEEVPCFEGAEHQQGIEHYLDRRAATSSPSWSAPSEGPLPGPVPLVPSDQAESLKHTSEKEKEGRSHGPACQPKLQGLLDRDQLARRDWAFDHVSEGACADLLGTGDAGPVDVVSTQLSRRILCDSLAALAGLVPRHSP